MKNYFSILIITLLTISWGCNDEEFLNRAPKNVFGEDQVYSSPAIILAVVGDLYARLPEYQTIRYWGDFTDFDEAFASEFGQYGRHQNQGYGYGAWFYWDYGFLREVNIFIQKVGESEALSPEEKDRFLAEGRFIRAWIFFEMVKRMGGVPLILDPLSYDFSGDPSYLQFPRAKEYEVYDFVISELEAIKNVLPNNSTIRSRATKGAALAMETRAALYAGSIAKYNVNTPSVSTAKGEVGIPADKADSYYQKALTAAKELIDGNQYALYNNKEDLQENFAGLFVDKSIANKEAIFVDDFKLKSGKIQAWTLANQPRYLAEEEQGGRINPSLNLVQSFEKLDNTFEPIAANVGLDQFLKDEGNNVKFFDSPLDLFKDRDARLGGTVILPGAKFKGKEVDIWAGYYYNDNGTWKTITGPSPNAKEKTPWSGEEKIQVVGGSGPIDKFEFTAQTGFYVRKYMDPTPGSGQIGTQSEVWWIRYRYAEVLLNAAEAAFELGQADVAAGYMNQVRRRAGLIVDLTAGDITFDRIVHERKVELAFEGHQLWDMKRWRLAHIVWNGVNNGLTTNPANAEESSTRPYGIWPYKVYNPGQPNDGKWVFQKKLPSAVTNDDRFQLGNYYSQISDDMISRNPLLVRNPNQN